jgi:apolipoprotein N-acyltransferase
MAGTGFGKNDGPASKSGAKPLVRPLLLAAAGGGLQTLAWPWPGWWPLCFVALLPLIAAAAGQSGRRALACGWVYGLVQSLTSLPWLADVLAGYGGLGFRLGWLVLFLLAAYLAIYPALFAWLITLRVPGPPWCWSLAGAGAWAGLDWLKNWVFTGFNWTPLAGPLALSPELGQAADVFGFYGLGFFAALINLWLASAFFLGRDRGPGAGRPYVLAALGLLALGFAYGRLGHEHWEAAADRALNRRVTVIQPALDQAEKWEPLDRDRHLALYSGLVREAGRTSPWLLLWPETALPFFYGADQAETAWLDALVSEVGGLNLVGVSALEGDWPGQPLHNRMLLFRDGRPGPWYDKRHLVPFGEYLPLDWLPFLSLDFLGGVVGAAGTYDPGRPQPPLDLTLGPDQARQVRLGLMICFESTFPHLGRERVLAGADLLVVPTNDGWFGRSRAPGQHLLQAAMRAVETRRPLVRAGNTGISAVIRPSGRISQATELMARGVFTLETPILAPADTEETVFLRWGHGLAPALAVWTGLMAGLRFWTGEKRRGSGGVRFRLKKARK